MVKLFDRKFYFTVGNSTLLFPNFIDNPSNLSPKTKKKKRRKGKTEKTEVRSINKFILA